MKRLFAFLLVVLCAAAAFGQSAPVALAPKFAALPADLPGPVLVVLYDATANVLDPVKPDFLTLRDGKYVFDAPATWQMIGFLRGRGVTRAVWDWEPQNQGDNSGYTAANLAVAVKVIKEFKAGGIQLDVFPFPLGSPAGNTLAPLSDTIHLPLYPFTADGGLWERERLKNLADARKAYPTKKLCGWVQPWSAGESGDGLPPVPAGTYAAELFDRYLSVLDRYCDAGVVWACRITVRPDGSSFYEPWDPAMPWAGRMREFNKGKK